MVEEGDRVGAIKGSSDDVVEFFGFGVYLGRIKPSSRSEDQRPVGWIGDVIVESDRSNPLIKLDEGGVVWGCECWWGSEDAVSERIANWTSDNRRLEMIDVDQWREEVRTG